MRGLFITLYGINNIGKSTHAKRLVDALNASGHEAVYVKYPVYDLEPTGPFLNTVLRQSSEGQKISEQELQMWFTLNRFQFEPTLKTYLEKGVTVVAEDYTGTGLAWGSTKGAELQWLECMNQHLMKEDVAILIQGERSLHAKEHGHIHESHDDLVERCGKILAQLGEKYGWHQVDLQPEKDATAALIWDIVSKSL